jgi:hypothetical protein
LGTINHVCYICQCLSQDHVNAMLMLFIGNCVLVMAVGAVYLVIKSIMDIELRMQQHLTVCEESEIRSNVRAA